MLAALLRSLRQSLSRSSPDAQPATAAEWNDRGVALQAAGDAGQALLAFERAVAADAGLAVAQLNLAHCLLDSQRDYHGARERYRAALALDPMLLEARKQLALVLYELGEVAEALQLLSDDAAQADPSASQYALFMRNAVGDHEAQAHFDEHVRWARRHLPTGVPRPRGRDADRAARIRIGYLSGDFHEHATAAFLLPVLEGHDRDAFEIYGYASQASADEMTRRMAASMHGWRDVSVLSDAQAAERIRADGIDVLVDLSGHTRGNWLGILALRPAPVQASYLGYLNTTGLAAIDYRITDSRFDPPGASEALHTEKLLRLDPCCWGYRPSIGEQPAQRTPPADGSIRFGSFNHIAKINARVVQTWARILLGLPRARLDFIGLSDAHARERLMSAFADHGVGRYQLGFQLRLDAAGYAEALRNTDIALDSFPYTGGRTTCDALWAGVPVISLAGDFGFARSGAAVLGAAELDELVAQSEDEYVRLATELALAPQTLGALRESLPERLRQSALRDEAGLVRRLEDAYRWMVSEGRRDA